MPSEIEVEINLRIPRVKDPVKDESGYPVDNGQVRYIRRLTVPALPKPQTLLQLPTSAGAVVECEVIRADWNDGKNLFVVYTTYSKRSIPSDQYLALVRDPSWEMRPLLG